MRSTLTALICLNIAVGMFYLGDNRGYHRADDEAFVAQVAIARQAQKFKHASTHTTKVSIWSPVDEKERP